MQLDKPLSTFPPSADLLQQLRGGETDAAPENAGHKINVILFFYPDTIHYICDNQLKI